MNNDYKRALALSLILNQLSESPNHKAIVNAIARTYDDQDEVLKYIANIDVYTAVGVWLDLLGSIVGQSRKVTIDLTYQYFGYSDIDPNLSGYGVSIYWYPGAPGETSNLLNDEEYRRVIIARAAKNSGDTSLINIVSTMQQVLGSEVFAYNSGNATVTIMFEGEISDNILALIRNGDIVPTAAGVGLRSLLNYDSATAFGYSDIDPTLQGYGNGEYARDIL